MCDYLQNKKKDVFFCCSNNEKERKIPHSKYEVLKSIYYAKS